MATTAQATPRSADIERLGREIEKLSAKAKPIRDKISEVAHRLDALHPASKDERTALEKQRAELLAEVEPINARLREVGAQLSTLQRQEEESGLRAEFEAWKELSLAKFVPLIEELNAHLQLAKRFENLGGHAAAARLRSLIR